MCSLWKTESGILNIYGIRLRYENTSVIVIKTGVKYYPVGFFFTYPTLLFSDSNRFPWPGVR